MKIVVMSDNHGLTSHIDRIKELEKDANFFVHCGDFCCDDHYMSGFHYVRGNNDWYSDAKDTAVFMAGNKRIGVVHGHRFGYGNVVDSMLSMMDMMELDILCTGHTHRPMYLEEDGKIILNPGSTALPRGSKASYCVIEINNDEVEVIHKPFTI